MKTIGVFVIIMSCTGGANAQETICHKYVKINPAQTPSDGPRCRVVGDTFYIDGVISEEMYYELRDYSPQLKNLELNSFGGLVESGYKIAELVRKQGLRTNVRKGAKCASACTLIYQAGVQRTAYPLARFLYHGARLSNLWVENWLEMREQRGREVSLNEISRQFIEVRSETEKFFEQLIFYGVDPQLIKLYRDLPESETWFTDGNFTRTENWIISATRLLRFNVVQSFDFRETVPEE